jgi:hypothetical protein
MQEGLNSYTPSPLEFSSSKLFFQHQNKLLQNIGFISPMSIDVHFKYTFQEVQTNSFVQWGEFEWLNVDHEVVEQWLIYKVWFLNPKFKNIQHLSLDLKKNLLDTRSVWPLVLWLFWWLVVFFIFLWLYKYTIWKVLFWLNLAWALILLIFYGFKTRKSLYKKMFKTKNVDYGWFVASYASQSDALMLSNDVVWVLKKLWKDYWIVKVCVTGNCIYLLQDIHDREWNRLESSSKLYSEQEKAALQQKTLDYLRKDDFLLNFTS